MANDSSIFEAKVGTRKCYEITFNFKHSDKQENHFKTNPIFLEAFNEDLNTFHNTT